MRPCLGPPATLGTSLAAGLDQTSFLPPEKSADGADRQGWRGK
jgi:hypothetical protein